MKLDHGTGRPERDVIGVRDFRPARGIRLLIRRVLGFGGGFPALQISRDRGLIE